MERQQAEKIAQWWVDRMDDQCKHDNGDPDFATSLATGMEKLKAEGFKFKDTTVTGGQKAKFAKQLTAILVANGDRIEYIEVDYDPDEILEDCLFFAGIDFNPFPIKTIFWVQSMRCRVGYSGNVVEVTV